MIFHSFSDTYNTRVTYSCDPKRGTGWGTLFSCLTLGGTHEPRCSYTHPHLWCKRCVMYLMESVPHPSQTSLHITTFYLQSTFLCLSPAPFPNVCTFSNVIDLWCSKYFSKHKKLYPSPHFCASGRADHTWRLQLGRFSSSPCIVTMKTHQLQIKVKRCQWRKSHQWFNCIGKSVLHFATFLSDTVCQKSWWKRLESHESGNSLDLELSERRLHHSELLTPWKSKNMSQKSLTVCCSSTADSSRSEQRF